MICTDRQARTTPALHVVGGFFADDDLSGVHPHNEMDCDGSGTNTVCVFINHNAVGRGTLPYDTWSSTKHLVEVRPSRIELPVMAVPRLSVQFQAKPSLVA